MIIKIFAAPADYSIERLYRTDENELIIGVDKGAYHAVCSGLTLDVAIGDFDSTTMEETKTVRAHSRRFIHHSDEKNHTDTNLALIEARKHHPEKIIIYGGIGHRLDHTVANILLLYEGRITMINDTTETSVLLPGTHTIDNPHKYVSFFALETVEKLTLTGFKYALENHELHPTEALCVSNEGSGVITFKQGRLLVVMSAAD